MEGKASVGEVHQSAVSPARNQTMARVHRKNTAPERARRPLLSAKSVILFLLGGILLIAACMVNASFSKKAYDQQQSNLLARAAGRDDLVRRDTSERIPVYIVGATGIVAIIVGIGTLGSKKG